MNAQDRFSYYETSFTQRRIHFYSSVSKDKTLYNRPLIIKLNRAVTVDCICRSLRTLFSRHEVLRTHVKIWEGKLVQAVNESREVELNVNTTKFDTISALFAQHKLTEFDVDGGTLTNITWYPVVQDYGVLYIDKHLLLTDSFSDEMLTRELLTLLDSTGEDATDIVAKKYDNVDAILWQNDIVEEENSPKISEWHATFANSFPDFAPGIKGISSSPHTEKKYRKLSIPVPDSVVKSVKEKCDQTNRLEDSFFLAVFFVLLKKVLNREDVVIACNFTGRESDKFDTVCGNFENLIPFRLLVKPNFTVDGLWNSVDRHYRQNEAHVHIPFDFITERLRSAFGNRIDRLFDIGFAVGDDSAFADMPGTGDFMGKGLSGRAFDLYLYINRGKQQTEIHIEYEATVWDDHIMDAFPGCFLCCVGHFIAANNLTIKELNVLPAVQKEMLLAFNRTSRDFSITDPIHVVFERQVHAHPGKHAAIHNGESIDYQTLDRNANKLARLLRQLNVGRQDFVGIYMERGIPLLTGLIAIFKAGGAYIPFDTLSPRERIADQITDSGTKVILVDEQSFGKDPELLKSCKHIESVICLDTHNTPIAFNSSDQNFKFFDRTSIEDQPASTLQNINTETDWAYMLYTSGSTGKPKGAILRHDGAINHIFAEYDALKLAHYFRFLQSANISSDISVWQLLAPLLCGGATVIIDKVELLNYRALLEIIQRCEVTIVEFVPSFLTGLIDFLVCYPEEVIPLPSLKWMMMVGEEVPVDLVNTWLRLYPDAKVINGYGPAEASDDITQFIMDNPLPSGVEKVPIGMPLANLNILVLDQDRQLMPVGTIGEICVSGIGVGVGYWKNKEKTSEHFIQNTYPGYVGDVVYRTGDLGRWLANGVLEFYGRRDTQLKIHGFRVEKGEVEVALRSHHAVVDAATISWSFQGENQLVCYLVVDPAASVQWATFVKELKGFLRTRLPEYMIPRVFKLLEQLPQNLSDKIDYVALPAPTDEDFYTRGDFQLPANLIEHKLLQLWKEILHLPSIGMEDDFFALGGNSLKATQLIARIYKVFQANVNLANIFDRPTIRGLGNVIHTTTPMLLAEIEKIPYEAHYPLTHAQKRMWIVHQDAKLQISYNMPGALMIEGELDPEIMLGTLHTIIARHESLRTNIRVINSEPRQIIHDPENYKPAFKFIDWSNNEIGYELSLGLARNDSKTAFDLENSPLLRITLVRLKNNCHLLVFNIHHIISDGLSNEILIEEIFEVYASALNGVAHNLRPLRFTYKDYAVWQNRLLESSVASMDRLYWLDKLSGTIPAVELSISKNRESISIVNGGCVEFTFSVDDTSALEKLNKQSGSTMFITMVALVKILLFKYSNQDDIIVGSPVSGRINNDIEPMVGLFLNYLVLRDNINKTEKFSDFLLKVRQTVTEAFEHQLYPYDKLVEDLAIRPATNRNPFYDVLVVMNTEGALNGGSRKNKITDSLIVTDTIELDYETSKLDLSFFFQEGDQLKLTVEYCADLFSVNDIEGLVKDFETITQTVLHKKEITIGEVKNILKDITQRNDDHAFYESTLKSIGEDFN